MMTLLYTLLTLAVGVLFGTAATSFKTKMWQKITGLFFLFCVCSGITIWCDNQMHPASLAPLLNNALNILIMLYGAFLGAFLAYRKEIKEESKDAGKLSWITVTAIRIFAVGPIMFWPVLMILSPWDAWKSTLTAMSLGAILSVVIFVTFHFAWVLKYGFTTKPEKS